MCLLTTDQVIPCSLCALSHIAQDAPGTFCQTRYALVWFKGSLRLLSSTETYCRLHVTLLCTLVRSHDAMVGGDQKWAAQRCMQVTKPTSKDHMHGKGMHTEGHQDHEALHCLHRRWVVMAMCEMPLNSQGHMVICMHGHMGPTCTKPTPMHATQVCC